MYSSSLASKKYLLAQECKLARGLYCIVLILLCLAVPFLQLKAAFIWLNIMYMVLLNYNFISTCMDMHVNMR